MLHEIQVAANSIKNIKDTRPEVGLVLGSGLGPFVENIEDQTIIQYSDLPYFHQTTVEGHEGRLILGTIGGTRVAVLQGRVHSYEGHPMEEVVFPTRVLANLGVKSLILTNAAGGINPTFTPGDLILIEDHINLMGRNPLVGANPTQLGPRFPDMTQAYNPELRQIIHDAAKEIKMDLKQGIYAGLLGPSYETPAEIKMLRTIGADMVGMSTVPEAIAANHMGVKVAGLSCITNMAAGMKDVKLKHEDIKEQAVQIMETFGNLLKSSITRMNGLGS